MKGRARDAATPPAILAGMGEVGVRIAFGVPAVLTLITAAALAGCTTQPDRPQGEVGSANPSTGSRDCGRVSLGHGQRVPADSLTCLANAADVGDPATLTVVSLTVEGDEIATGYTVTGPGLVRVRLDTTADKFAGTGAGITEQTCRIKVTEAGIQTDSCTDPVPVSSPVPSTAG